jgi:hypothetical protein
MDYFLCLANLHRHLRFGRHDTARRQVPTELLVRPSEDCAIRRVVAKQAAVHARLLVQIVDRAHVVVRELDELGAVMH